MTDLELAICESCTNGQIDEDTRDLMLSVYQESVFSPMKKWKDKLKYIKKAKPSEYDGPEEIKNFVDKSYDDIMNSSEILEKEPSKLRSNDVKAIIGVLAATLTAFAVSAINPLAETVSLTLFLTGWVGTFCHTIITYIRSNDDIECANALDSVRTALKKIDKDKLSDTDKKKVSDLLTAIDDAQSEVEGRLKLTKESTDKIHASIFESFANGEIDEDTRDLMLSVLESTAEEDKLAKNASGLYAKESVNELRKSIYEAELAGDITVEERAVLIDRLNKKLGI